MYSLVFLQSFEVVVSYFSESGVGSEYSEAEEELVGLTTLGSYKDNRDVFLGGFSCPWCFHKNW